MENYEVFILPIITLMIGFIIGFVLMKYKALAEKEHLSTANSHLKNELVSEQEASRQKIKEKQEESIRFLDEFKQFSESQLLEIKEETSKDKKRLDDLILQEREEAKREAQEKKQFELLLSQQSKELDIYKEKLENQKKEVIELQQKLSHQFENLANKILEEKTQKFTKQNKDNLEIVLNPLQKDLKAFKEEVDRVNKEQITRTSALKQQIEDLSKLNQQISKEALNLTKALKGDVKTMGNWGEEILNGILERSGLTKGLEYESQNSYTNMEGKRLQPDVIVNLPDAKKIIIDSKVSLVAYTQFSEAETKEDKDLTIKNHLVSIKNHIKGLGEKQYHTIHQIEAQTLDFVLLFIPIEGAFSLAIQNDNQLFNYAFERNIVIVSPSTLLATLKVISNIWKYEYQNKNALEIARKSGALYDKFNGLMEDLVKVETRMNQTQSDFNNAMNKLYKGRGNLIRSVEQIKTLGAKANKQLNQTHLDKADE